MMPSLPGSQIYRCTYTSVDVHKYVCTRVCVVAPPEFVYSTCGVCSIMYMYIQSVLCACVRSGVFLSLGIWG